MSKLINLQTLNLYRCSSLQKLPWDMSKIVDLQYLTLDDCHSLTSMPYGLGQLTDLRKLSLFVVGKRDRKNDALRELNRLNELRGRLEIKLLGNEESVNLGGANLEEKQYLESLWSLLLLDVNDLESLPELVQRVHSLAEMDITGSLRLNSQLPQCIRFLSSLEKLTIGGCDPLDLQFDDNDDDCQWQDLKNLRHLIFDRVEDMEYLPKWINHITTLQHLTIPSCGSLMWLPERMILDKLEIILCPQLEERYGNNKGVEWPSITFKLIYRWIQLEGQYQGS
ncbi:NBS-LRR type disease resistance protein [Melia azedarach]|uniref:NBS-LRR type disease resistance protein n=1 Tax=Melia azedarach TaxID=155640 RepID=A0ACC1XVX8_MELAZ|nr:NBS-LRR type disease resistance protein [Melia azedarach]